MTATTDRCPGCHGSGIEMSGVTYAGMSEYVGCHECGPECPDDCGCRASDATERPESVAPRHPGATQSPDGSQGAPEGPRGAESATGPDLLAVLGVQIEKARAARHATSSDVRPVSPAQGVPDAPGASLGSSGYRSDPPALNGPQRGAERVSDAEAAEWARLAGEATEGPWTVDPDGDIGAPLAGGLECGMDGHPVLDCPECGVMVARIQGFDGGLDAAFIAAARTAVPRLLADRERLTAENARMRQVAELRVGTWRDTAARLEGERDRARGTAATLEAENARLTEALYLTRITLEATFRVLQEASGLPDDIDDPDCRDEMVLALRPRAEKAEAENARLAEEATVSAALLETEIAKREAAEMRANRATADLDALESEDQRQDVQAKHWREVLRIRRELDGIRREMNDVTEIIAEALGYRPSGLPLDGWPHLSTTGDHTPTSLAAEAAGVLAKASRLREGIEALAAEMEADPSNDRTAGPPQPEDYGMDLRALLAEGGE